LSGDTLVSIIAIAAALLLAFGGLKSRRIAPGKRLTMALVWLLIIVGVVYLIHSLGVGNVR
jgi:uncharacterized membrane protein